MLHLVLKTKIEETNKKYEEQKQLVADQTHMVAEVNVEYENIQQSLPEIRSQESYLAAELQKNTINFNNQEKEIERANSAVEEIQIRSEQIKNDNNREQFLFQDAKENLSRVREEKSLLEKQQGDLFIEEMKIAAAKAIAALAREEVPDEVVNAYGGERPHYGKK